MGGVVFVAVLAASVATERPLWLPAPLALAPDPAMAGSLAGARVGATAYTLVHTYIGPLVLLGAGVLAPNELAVSVALVWAGHVDADRLVGYGLKSPSGFTDTHRSRQPAPFAALADDD